MALDILDRAMSGLGLTVKPQDKNIDRARDYALGTREIGPGLGVNLPGIGPNSPGGLIPAYETMARDREAYIQDFTGERDRVLSQVEENRAGYRPFNEAATGALPDLISGATPEGFLSRVSQISASPELQSIIDRENNRRMRAAQSQLAAGGLTRSGAAAAAAADATLTPEERAFQIEPELYRRSGGLANLYRDLPIANMQVLDTYRRDMMMADNLERQGETRSQAELLKGQVSKEAAETMLTNLIKAYGAASQGGGTTIVNQVSNTLSDLIGDVIARGGDAVAGMGDWLGSIFDGVFDGNTGSDGRIDIPGFNIPDINIPDINVPDVDFPSVDVPDSPVAAPTPTPTPPVTPTPTPPVAQPPGTPQIAGSYEERIAELMRRGMTREQAERNQASAVRQGADLDNSGFVTAAEWREFKNRQTTPAPPGSQTPDDDQYYGELPALPGVGVPNLGAPGLDIDDTVEDIAGSIGGSITDTIFNSGAVQGGNGFGSNFAPQPGSGGPPNPVNLPGLGTTIGSAVSAYGGREVGQAIFGKDATQSWGSNVGAAVGYSAGGPVGAVIGSFIGSIVDSAFGTSDQKNVTIGAATTKPGDDMTGELQLSSGLTLYGINRRGGDGSATENYMNSLGNIDNFLTEAARQGGFDVALNNAGFGGEVAGKGKNLKANPTFFGSATEGSGETDKAHVGRNIAEGYDRFIDSWFSAAVDQGQITGATAEQVKNLTGTAEEKLAQFAQLMNVNQPIEARFAVAPPAPPPSRTEPLARAPGDLNAGGRLY